MKNAFEVLYEREADLARVRLEVESLTIVASLLTEDESSSFDPGLGAEGQNKKRAEKVTSLPSGAKSTGTDSRSAIPRRAGFWGSLTRRH
jgi:hypothetical protein